MTNSYLKKMSKINSKDPFVLQQFILQNFKNDLKEKQLFELEKLKKVWQNLFVSQKFL